MNDFTASRIVTVLITSASLFYVWTLYRDRDHPDSAVARRSYISSLFLVIAALSAIPRPVDLRFHLTGIIAVQQGLLFAYFVVKQLLSRQGYQPLWTSKLYLIVTLLSAVVAVLDFLRRDNLGSFIDNDPFKPSVIYYSSYVLHYGLSLFVISKIIYLYWRDLRYNPHVELTYGIRRFLSALAFLLGAMCMILVEINIIIYITYDSRYQVFLNQLYQYIRQIFILCLVISPSIPQWLMEIIVYPIRRYKTWEENERNKRISKLHNLLTNIAPGVVLDNNSLQLYRQVIEIYDARDVIFSNIKLDKVSPKAEALLIVELYKKKEKFSDIGPFTPPSIPEHQLPSYFVSVARFLEGLDYSL